MGYFPLCMNITGKLVILVGNGPQIKEKRERLMVFDPEFVSLDTLMEKDLEASPAMVVVGDLNRVEAERIYKLCVAYHIPVNVVDVPEFCTFYFPAMITRGPLTVAISTSGSSPAAAALLRRRMEKVLPDRTEEILDWIGENRKEFRQLGIMKVVVERAFDVGRPLTQEEISDIIER